MRALHSCRGVARRRLGLPSIRGLRGESPTTTAKKGREREREREGETDKMGEDEDGDGERQRSVASGETTRCKLDPRERADADEDAGGHHHG